MEKEFYNIEGLELEVDKITADDKEGQRERLSAAFRKIREISGMNRSKFSKWLGIPYRTMQEWELGRRAMPEYVLRLIAYKVIMEKNSGRIGQ
ncbi:MAG: XRE family transcriptional regulator [Lachnospiraceae bacterium]|nr:XRE family transcriptional regulator [Lachnospiraceae bacterium]